MKTIEIINELKITAEKMLNEIEKYNMETEIVLMDYENIENSKVISMYEDGEFGYVIRPYEDEILESIDWNYSYDKYLFKDLEKGMEIGLITDETHLAIWKDIERLYPEKIKNKQGMQKYLKYCKEKGITKEYLEKTTNQKEFANVMKYYKKRDRER